MAAIPESYSRQLKENFAKLDREVRLLAFVKEGGSSEKLRALVEELGSLSDKIKLEVYDFANAKEAKTLGIARAPALVAIADNQDHGIRYYGIPVQQELPTLATWLLGLSEGEAGLKEDTRRKLGELEEERRLTVLITYACPTCPGVVQQAMKFAMASGMVSLDVIDIAEFPEAKEEFPVLLSTPKVFAGKSSLTGPRGGDEESLLELIVKEVKK